MKLWRAFILIVFVTFLNICDLSAERNQSAKARYVFSDKKSGLYGLLDENGEELVSPKYKYIGWLKDGLMPAFENDWFVLIKEDGTVINRKFWDIEDFKPVNEADTSSDKFAVAALYKMKKYGFINLSGDFIVKPVYEKIRTFSNGYAEVKIDGKWGYMNGKGNIVISAIYDDVWPFSKNNTALVAKNGKQCLINSKNKLILSCEYDKIRSVNNVIYSYKKSNEESKLFDIDGKIIFHDKGSGTISDLHEKMTKYRSAGGKTIILNDKNRIILRGNFSISSFYYKGILEIEFPGNQLKYIDTTGTYISFVEYLKRNYKGKHFIWHRFGKSSLINNKGKYILQPEYEFNELKQVAENVFLITKKKSLLFLPPSSYYTVSNSDKLMFSGVEGYVFFEKSGKIGTANEKGRIIVPAIYDEIKGGNLFSSDEDKNIFRVRQGKKWGVINEKGEVVFPMNFQEIAPFYLGESIAYKIGKKYVIEKNGKIKFVTTYDVKSVFYIDGGMGNNFSESWHDRRFIKRLLR